MNPVAPSLSVILPVFNCEKYIKDSINSILVQTFTDFELIIIDDGSTDGSANIVQSFKDPRIRFIQQANLGLSKALNIGISLSKADLIARQDADDISLATRFEVQMEYMGLHPECTLVGSWARIISKDKLTNRFLIHPTSYLGCRYKLMFDCCFTHTSVIFRRKILDEIGLFSEDNLRVPPVDYELWSRMSRHNNLSNIPEVLVYYRELPNSMSFARNEDYRKRTAKISQENIEYLSTLSNKRKIAQSISEINHLIPELTYGDPDFYEINHLIKQVVRSIYIDSAKTNLDVESAKISGNLMFRWIANYTIFKYINCFVKPIVRMTKMTIYALSSFLPVHKNMKIRRVSRL